MASELTGQELLKWQHFVADQEYLLDLLFDRVPNEEREDLINGLKKYLEKYLGTNEEYALSWLKNKIELNKRHPSI